MLAPQTQQMSNKASAAMTQETNPVMPDGSMQHPSPSANNLFIAPEDGTENAEPTPEEIDAHLDSLPDDAKAFLAEHLTPEFVTAIGLISGQAVANHLMKYADKDKVLVPVPRKVAEENLAQMKAQASVGQSQQTAPQASPAPAPQGGMMAPMQQTATPQ